MTLKKERRLNEERIADQILHHLRIAQEKANGLYVHDVFLAERMLVDIRKIRFTLTALWIRRDVERQTLRSGERVWRIAQHT